MRNFIKNKEGKVNKKLAIPLAILVVIGLGVTIYAISAYFASLQVTATVNEPVFVSNDNGNNYVPLTSNIQLTAQASSVYPGESTTLATIYVENKASVNEPVYLTMTNTANTVDGANWATNGNGYLLDGSAIMIAPGFHTIVVTTAYNGQMNGAELQATIMIGGTFQNFLIPSSLFSVFV